MPEVFEEMMASLFASSSTRAMRSCFGSSFSTIASRIQSASFTRSRSSSQLPVRIRSATRSLMRAGGLAFFIRSKPALTILLRISGDSSVRPFCSSSSVSSLGAMSRRSTSRPELAAWAAIAAPIVPAPRTATRRIRCAHPAPPRAGVGGVGGYSRAHRPRAENRNPLYPMSQLYLRVRSLSLPSLMYSKREPGAPGSAAIATSQEAKLPARRSAPHAQANTATRARIYGRPTFSPLLRVLLAQRLLVDLTDARLVDLLHEDDLVGHGELRDLAAVCPLLDVCLDLVLRNLVIRVERDQGERAFSPLLVFHPDHRSFAHALVLREDVFDGLRRDPLATGLDYVLDAIGHLQVALLVDVPDVLGMEVPALPQFLGLLGLIEVSLGQPRRPDDHLASGLAVVGHVAHRCVDDPQIHQGGGPAGPGPDLHLLVEVTLEHLGCEVG